MASRLSSTVLIVRLFHTMRTTSLLLICLRRHSIKIAPKMIKKGRRVLGARIPSAHAKKYMHTHSGHPSPISHSSSYSKSFLAHIQATVNDRWDRTNLRTQLLLHSSQPLTVVLGNQIHSQTQVPKTSRTTNAVQIGLTVLGKIKVNDNIHGLDIDTSSEEIC